MEETSSATSWKHRHAWSLETPIQDEFSRRRKVKPGHSGRSNRANGNPWHWWFKYKVEGPWMSQQMFIPPKFPPWRVLGFQLSNTFNPAEAPMGYSQTHHPKSQEAPKFHQQQGVCQQGECGYSQPNTNKLTTVLSSISTKEKSPTRLSGLVEPLFDAAWDWIQINVNSPACPWKKTWQRLQI